MEPQTRPERPTRARPRDYAVGLGLAFALIVVAVGIVFYGLTFSIQRGMRIGKAEALEALHLRHSGFAARYDVPEPDRRALQDLVAAVDRDSASYWAVDLAEKLLVVVFDDGRITADERRLVETATGLLAPNPGVGPSELRQLLDREPQLAQLYDAGSPGF